MKKDNNVNQNEKKKILMLVVIIATLVVSTTGATYAYFALKAVNNNVITGTSATVGGTLTVERIIPTSASWNLATTNKVMVPQYSAKSNKNALKQAIDNGCIDANHNVVCQVYRIIFTNQSTSNARISSLLELESAMQNLKWYTLKTENNKTGTLSITPTSYTYPASLTVAYGNARSVTSLGSSLELNVNSFRYWDVAIWIEETGNDQYSADGSKSFSGTVTVNSTDTSGNVNGGITSTFVGS